MVQKLGGKRRTGRDPLAYMGVEPSSPANLLRVTDAPGLSDTNHNIGTMWLHDKNDSTVINDVYILVNIDNTLTSLTTPQGPAQWLLVGIGTGEVSSLTGDSGGAVFRDGANNIDILGGDLITTVGTPGSSLLSIGLDNGTDGQLIIGSTAGSPAYATVTSTGSTITVTSGAGTLNIDVTAPLAVDHGGTGATTLTDHGVLLGSGTSAITPLGVATDGQLVIGSTGADPVIASLTSSGSTIVFTAGAGTLNLETGATVSISFPTDSGTAVPAAGALTIAGSHGLNSAGAASTVTVAIDNTITLGDLSVLGAGVAALTCTTGDIDVLDGNIELPDTDSSGTEGVMLLGSNRFMHNFGTTGRNTFLGEEAGSLTLASRDSVGIGYRALQVATALTNVAVGSRSMESCTLASANTALGHQSLLSFIGTTNITGQNVAIGFASLQDLTEGDSNVCLGNASGGDLTTSGQNLLLGNVAARNLVTGSFNFIAGVSPTTGVAPSVNGAGYAYTGSESSNLILGNVGVNGESNVLRIGTTGSGATQQNKAFIAAIRGVTTDNADAIAVLVDSAGQLGTVSSSIRVKNNVEDMGTSTGDLLSLRPVMFDYIKNPSDRRQYGLIAEEVEKIMPDLVVYDKEQLPETVRYNDIPVMLLNEMKKLHDRIVELEKRLQ